MEKEARNLFGMGQTTLGNANRATANRRSSMAVLFVLGEVSFDGCVTKTILSANADKSPISAVNYSAFNPRESQMNPPGNTSLGPSGSCAEPRSLESRMSRGPRMTYSLQGFPKGLLRRCVSASGKPESIVASRCNRSGTLHCFVARKACTHLD
jgi:hypothetical protein